MFKNLLIRIFSLSIFTFYAGNNFTYALGCNSVLSFHKNTTLQKDNNLTYLLGCNSVLSFHSNARPQTCIYTCIDSKEDADIIQVEDANTNIAHRKDANVNIAHREDTDANMDYRENANVDIAHREDTDANMDYRKDANANIVITSMLSQQATHSPFDSPPSWLALPFILLLLMIATGPLLYASFWHKNYPKISILLAGLVIGYYLFVLGNYIKPVEAIMEYLQFIALISALYLASGGILMKVNQAATPTVNLLLLLVGAILSNLIGTTGASMLLIRPYIRLNQKRIKVYHIVCFIFIVSNIGGALTPIGDPPLFLGFLKGVPFFWTLQHNFLPWLIAISLLSLIFFWLDSRNKTQESENKLYEQGSSMIQVVGKRNFFWFLLIILAVFIDPNIFDWVPAIHYHGHDFSFLRELLLFGLGWASYKYANRTALQGNAFSFGPIKEVVLIFIGIFGTMIPALTLISAFAQSEAGINLISHNTLYWGSGIFSSVLDNAPTYLNFLAASMASQGADILQASDVYHYAMGQGFVNSMLRLKSISIASVFFGAMTYIGNGPNFMVKSIAEQLGVRMPPFFSYIIYFAIPFLLPVLFLVWFICFYLQLI